MRGKFVSMISRTRGVNETCECEKVTSSAIYKIKDNMIALCTGVCPYSVPGTARAQ